MTTKSARDVLQETMRRAAHDADFRRLAVINPKHAMELIHGAPLAKLAIRFVDNSTESIQTIVLPPFMPMGGDAELSDAELEVVAGGMSGTTLNCSGTIV